MALKEIKHGKAVGPDGIPVEVWKSLGEEDVDNVVGSAQGLKIFEEKMSEEWKMPEEWRDSVIVPILKEKGDIQDCGNYRGIKMISHTYHEDLGKNNRRKTEGGDKQRRRAVRFHVEQRDN